MKPQTVQIQIDPPSRRYPAGRTVEGMFVVEDGAVILTDRDGYPVVDDKGQKYTRKLAEGENPRRVAGRLTKEFRLALRGPNAPRNGFDRPIAYAKGWRGV